MSLNWPVKKLLKLHGGTSPAYQLLWLLALLCLLQTKPVSAQMQDQRNYTLTISGGISLGVYEAGLNWVILELLRNRSLEQPDQYGLRAVTGASAGAINTLIAALRYCEQGNNIPQVENNLFAKTWRNIDISEMLPDDPARYNQLEGYADGIISRSVFSEIITALEKSANSKNFRNGCHLNLGLSVTRSIPEVTAIGKGAARQEIKIQRFVIPIVLRIENGEAIFRNNLEFAKNNGELGYLFLRQDETGKIQFKNVVRAVLASSAFPLAFGRVRMQYCRPQYKKPGSTDCPVGYEPQEYDFVDGGVFDNIPLGLAVELSECQPSRTNICTPKPDSLMHYIYMDPSNRRTTSANETTKNDDEALSPGYGFYNQSKFWIKAQDVYANAELYRTLASKFREEDLTHRRLLLTNRYAPLGGAYLAHFGAFFDKSFRDFDYYAGIYDGIINASKHLIVVRDKKILEGIPSDCFINTQSRTLKDNCFGNVVEILTHELLHAKDQAALRMVRMLAEHEFDPHQPQWQWLQQLPDYNNTFVNELFIALHEEKELNIEKLLERLKLIQAKPPYANLFGAHLSTMLNDADTWKIDIGRKIVNRLSNLERADQEHNEVILPLKLANMAFNSYDVTENNKLWAISSFTPTSWSQYLIPDEIAFDGRQSNLIISYRGVIHRLHDSRTYWDWEFSPLHWKRRRDETSDNYSSIGINLRTARESALYSSYGVGLRAYQNHGDKVGLENNVIYGASFNLSFFADKFRISLEYRKVGENKVDDHMLLKFGLGDIKGFSHLLFGE